MVSEQVYNGRMSVVALGPPAKLTAEEYSKLPDVIGFKDELIEGVRYLSPMPKFFHTFVIDTLEALLKEQFPDMRTVREAGWYFTTQEGSESVPGPDLMLVRTEDYDRAVVSGGYFKGKPLFVIEVVSPTERKSRRLQKVGLYLEAGAESVVEIDYTKKCAFIYRNAEDVPDEVVRDRITSPFSADLAELFAKAQ